MARFDRIDALMLALVAIWGSAFAGLRALRGVLDPYEMTWFRYALFPLAYGAWIAVRRRDVLLRVTGGDWLRMTVLGLLAVVGYHFSLNTAMVGVGEHSISAATGAVIVATVPVWTMALAVVSRKEPLRVPAALGTAVAFAGVAIVVVRGTPGADLELGPLGALAMIAPISWGIYGVWAKPLIAKYGGLFTTGITMSLGTLVLVPFGIDAGLAPLRGMTAGQWGWLLFLGIVSTIAGYAMYNHALKHRAASDVAVYIYLNPVMATVVGWLALGEAVTWWFAVGAVLVLAGVIQVQRSRTALVPAPVSSAKV